MIGDHRPQNCDPYVEASRDIGLARAFEHEHSDLSAWYLIAVRARYPIPLSNRKAREPPNGCPRSSLSAV
jgi:hypothetical protein